MNKDYSNLHQSIAGDVTAAATAASLVGGKKRKKLRLRGSDLPSLVPGGSQVCIEAVAVGKLTMGYIICINPGNGEAPQVRRFVKLKITKDDTYLLTASEGVAKKQPLPKSALVGKVVEAEANGKKWDPTQENPLKKFWGKLTEYGTHKPFGIGK